MNAPDPAGFDRRTPVLRAVLLPVLLPVLALPMAAFFAFVGWYKAFAPVAELARHHAWTAHVPQWLGRPMGWTELAGAAAMAVAAIPVMGRRARPVAQWAALWLAASQFLSAAVHVTHGEADALPQNLFLLVALLVIAALCRLTTPTENHR